MLDSDTQVGLTVELLEVFRGIYLVGDRNNAVHVAHLEVRRLCHCKIMVGSSLCENLVSVPLQFQTGSDYGSPKVRLGFLLVVGAYLQHFLGEL